MPDYLTDLPDRPEATSDAGHDVERTSHVPLAEWLLERAPGLREQWLARIVARHGVSEAWSDVTREFIAVITGMVVPALGPLRREVAPLWTSIAELFGRAAAERGLAAGEVIEELQILRELVIRELYRDPPGDGVTPVSARDLLLLNRAVDQLVTHGSIGHTDALFFKLFDGHEEGAEPVGATADTVMEQLQSFRSDVERLARLGAATPLVVRAEH